VDELEALRKENAELRRQLTQIAEQNAQLIEQLARLNDRVAELLAVAQRKQRKARALGRPQAPNRLALILDLPSACQSQPPCCDRA